MSIIKKWWNEITGKKAAPVSLRPAIIRGEVAWYNNDGSTFIDKGYTANDIVYSAVNMVMDKVRCAPWGLYKVDDESSLKAYRGIMSKKDFSGDDWAQAMKLRKKALVPMEKFTSQAGKLKEKLTWPNEYETFTDLIANSVGYEMITGNSMWDAVILDMGTNKGVPEEIYNLPADLIQVIATRGYPNRIIGYRLEAGGEPINFEKERILHIRHWNPMYDINGGHLYGLSPLRAASQILKRSNSAKEASVSAFENGGAIGVLYVDDDRMSPEQGLEQIAAVKDKWNNEYSGKDAFRKVAHSGYKTGFTKITDTLVDMNLIEVENLDMRRLFNIWGLPSQLANDPENKTYNNQKEAEVALTSRGALPKLTSRRDNLNRKLQTDWGFKGVNIYADFDMSVFTELQEDNEKKWNWVKTLPVSTAYKLEMMGLDVPEGEEMETILIPKGFERLIDVASDQAANIENELNQVDENEKP